MVRRTNLQMKKDAAQELEEASSEIKNYSSIENDYNERFMTKVRQTPNIGTEQWIATEKIHGSNFSIYKKVGCDQLVFCKRSGPIPPKEDFMGYKETMHQINEQLLHVFEQVEQGLRNTDHCQIFGELFGGIYPGLPTTKIIQKDVYYTNGHDFSVFDIKVDGKYLPATDVIEICKNAGLSHVPVLGMGTFEEVSKIPFEFDSLVYERYGHPKIDGNQAEGLVLKPVVTGYLISGQRVILKRKTSKFREVTKTREPSRSQNLVAPEKKIDPEISTHLVELDNYINKNRFDAVRSKLGDVAKPRLIIEMIRDALAEYQRNLDISFSKERERSILDSMRVKYMYQEF